MPKYRVPGIGKQTGRRREKVYEAATLDEALEKAYADETIVDLAAVTEIPEEPATDAQLKLARDLGLTLPADPTKKNLSVLLDAALQKERARPTDKQLRFAKKLGIKHPDRLTREELSDEIDLALENRDGAGGGPTCQLCGGRMKKKTVGRSFLVAAFFGLSFIVIGILLCLTGIGAVIGIPLIIIGLFAGSKRRKVLKCTSCGGLVERA